MALLEAAVAVKDRAEARSEFPGVDRKARMNLPFYGLPVRPTQERVNDFDEAVLPFTPEQAIAEAQRCLHCPDPAPCHKPCPAHNDISLGVWLIEQGKFVEAASVYRQTSCLPEVCGRVCPQENFAREPVLGIKGASRCWRQIYVSRRVKGRPAA